MINANDTAEKDLKPIKGIYLMTDIHGQQKKVEVLPGKEIMKIKPLDGSKPLAENYSLVYCWTDTEFKVYPSAGAEPLYLELENS